MEEKLTLLIAADLVPTESNADYFCKGDITKLLGSELEAEIKNADARIYNLESPITDGAEPIVKSGMNLKIAPKTVKGIKALSPDLLALANNHIRDFGEAGIFDTLKNLSDNGINCTGIGKCVDEARKTGIIAVNGKKVAVAAFAEHEFSYAKDDLAGANPYDPLTSFDDVKKASETADFTVVLYHGGKEHYPYPTPQLQRICRKFVEVGANLVVCQHSHCIGAREKYGNGWIVYGQGNFIFDVCEKDCWQTSLIIKADICSPGTEPVFLPIVKCGNTVRMANSEEANSITSDFNRRSEEISKPGFVGKLFDETANKSGCFYLRRLHGAGVLYKVADKITRNLLTKTVYKNKNKLAGLINCIECETHREVLTDYLRNLLDRK